MMSFENALEDTVRPAAAEVIHDPVDDVRPAPSEPGTHQHGSADAAARLLELAARTADQLVADAQTEAESLVTTARAEADALLQKSRAEAHQVAAELSRNRSEQSAELDRERTTALAGLAEEKSAAEAQIGTLRQLHSNHRNDMCRHLTEQLALLDATVLEPPRIGA